MAKAKSRALPKRIQSRRSIRLRGSGNIAAAGAASQAYRKLKPRRKRKRNRKAARLEARKNPSMYAAYLRSEGWQQRRLKALADAGNRCERCASTLKLHVHHLHYRTLGKEARADLQVLCEDCHATHHLAEVLGVSHEGLEEYMLR